MKDFPNWTEEMELHHEKLKGRGFYIASWCSHCNETEETNNHLFLHCKVTTQLWNLFLGLTHTEWTMPEHTADLLSCWISRGGRKSKKKWSIIPSCIWCHAFGGVFGKKEIADVMITKQIQ